MRLSTIIGLAFVTSWCAPGFLQAAITSQPNIVVILTDDQGYADISLNPHHPQEVSTPHMDALAHDGVTFTFPNITKERAILMAMLKHLNDGVGSVVAKLKQEGLFDNTLLFFLTDNGGSRAMRANNAPLRGFKGSLEEGGIRTPFVVSWPNRFSGRRTVDTPVISLDILPTVLDAIDKLPAKNNFDGKSLLPLLTGASQTHHDTLFWCKDGAEWAVRRGDWKLRSVKRQAELFNLSDDPSEQRNLADSQPAVVKTLSSAFDAWIEQMADPITAGKNRRKPGAATENRTDREEARLKKRKERRNRRQAEKKATKQDSARIGIPKARPDVLFIVCDDLNTHVTTSGYPRISTPAFDELAAAGMTFRRAYCQYPVCGPSRASFLSGLYPESTGVLDNKSDIRQTRAGTVSMPQRFKQAGYWTAAVGKVFHTPKIDPGEVAWNEVLRFDNDEMPHVAEARKAFEAQHDSVAQGKNRRLWREHLTTLSTQTRGQRRPGYGPSGLRDEQHRDGKNVRQVASWLGDQAYGDMPFLIACGIQKPHVPFLAPNAYFALYPKEHLSFRLTPAGFWNQVPKLAMVRRFEAFGFKLAVENDALRREYTQAYHACISFIDAQIGLLFDALKRNGLWDNTIIVLTSDHGYQLGEHFMWGKVTLFEECARVPLIVRVPGRTQDGSRTEGLVELVDIFPTLIDLCEVEAPHNLQGRSFASMLDDPGSSGKEVAFTVVSRGKLLGRSIRTTRWRYAEWGGADQAELYDLAKDPYEDHNLADDDRYHEQRRMMHELLVKAGKRAG